MTPPSKTDGQFAVTFRRWNPNRGAPVLTESMKLTWTFSVVLALALSGCAQPGGTETPAGSAATRTPARTAPAASIPASQGEVVTRETLEALLSQILADASDRTGVGQDELEVVQAQAVTWNDGSLGCPEPGQMYTQALVDGYHVIVDADGERLDYRAAEGGGFRLCENPNAGGGAAND